MLCPTGSPADVLTDASETIAPLHTRLWAAATDTQLIDGIHALVSLEAKTAAVRARLLAEISAREIPRKQLHWASTGEWYAHLAGLTLREANRAVKHAPRLISERHATLEALVEGQISPAQADIICRAIDSFPLSPTLRDLGEQALLAEAGTMNNTDFTKAADYLVERVDPDKAERKAEADLDREDRAAHLGRNFTIVEDGAGGVRIRGRGTLEDAATLRAALLPLTKPVPAIDPENPETPAHDVRDHGARMWDALVQLAQHALDTDLPPSSHGARPRVCVLVGLEDLREDLRDHYRPRQRGHQPDPDPTDQTPDQHPEPTPREQPEPAGDDTAFRSPDQPHHHAGPVTEDGLPLSVAAVRRMACDADIIPIVLGTNAMPLDVGRAHRLVTMALWIALIARDRHCAFPGCTRPPIMCHAHHLQHWADGGPTSLGNLVMLCGHHHRVIHDTPWEVRLNPLDGLPEFKPPPPRHGDPPDDEWIRQRPRHE